ncbi:MAG: elongation factor P [Desulfobacca sp. 4484_104]|nr:MAG: elongation factor P [Desulfobacca sp. 4484_104]RLA89510.1 MAG: elongation factor P [Deltaproteobacteria bacterium]
MYTTSDFKKGLKIEIDGTPYIIVDFLHVKPGKGGAFVRTKIKNLITGRVLEQNFRSGEKFARPDLQEKSMQYLYQEGDSYCLMDNETFEQLSLTAEQMGDSRNFLQDNINMQVLFYKGQPIGVELPTFVELAIAHTEPGVRGDTASGATKPATLETGAPIQVPLFIEEGDVVKIDTRTGGYIERVKQTS